jgi:hypothetical protein
MNALVALRKFILMNRDPENVAQIRSYIEEHVVELARDLGVSTETITNLLASVSDDSVLATKMLGAVKKAQASQRANKKEGRARAAQAAAERLASRAVFDGDRVHLDLPALLSSALTKRDDLIVFTTEDFTTSISMAPLFDLARLRRRDVTGFVDAEGLHVQWRNGRGGLNLRPKADPRAGRIVLSLSPKTAAVAA